MQIEQLLCEVRIAEDKQAAIQEYVDRLKAVIFALPNEESHHKVL